MGIQLQGRSGAQRGACNPIRICRICQKIRYRPIRNLGRPPGFQPSIRRLKSKTDHGYHNQCPDDKPSYPRASSHVINVAFVVHIVNAHGMGNSTSHIRFPEHSKRGQTEIEHDTNNFPPITIICKILSLGFIQKFAIPPFHEACFRKFNTKTVQDGVYSH